MSAELQYIWSRVQAELAAAIEDSSYRIWLSPLIPRELADGVLTLEATPQTQRWVADRYGRLLNTCASRVLSHDVQVRLLTPADTPELAADHAPVSSAAPPASPSPRNPLANPKLSFEQFVIGDANRLAHAAALAVAELPAGAYNPLFICGPPGVGKTHLLGAIATLLAEHNPAISLRYTTGEAFTSEFLRALSERRTDSFKSGFRDLDVLLLDDVQFLQHKTRTEEEFFHTFNALYDSGHQLVLTSDRPPSDLQALEDRLRERFAAGLVADIAPPDLPTRIAILRKRAHQDDVRAPEEVLHLLATRVTQNVRMLEGALIRTVAFASLTGKPLSLELAQQVLANLYPQPPTAPMSGRLSLHDITQATCAHFSLTEQELLSSSRSPRVAWPRQIAMFLARELTEDSLPAIGRHFGGRDHTTVLYACRRASARIDRDGDAHQAVESLRAILSTPPHAHSSISHDRSA